MLLQARYTPAVKRHDRRVWQRVAALRKCFEDRVFAGGIPRIRLKHECQWRELVAAVVGERRAEFEEELEASGVERFARAHDDAGRQCRPVFAQPSGARDLSLQYGAVEGVLKIPPAECSDSLNDFEPAEIGGMTQ